MALRSGEQLDPYEIVSPLGAGGIGEAGTAGVAAAESDRGDSLLRHADPAVPPELRTARTTRSTSGSALARRRGVHPGNPDARTR
jgi:hypothetical protein